MWAAGGREGNGELGRARLLQPGPVLRSSLAGNAQSLDYEGNNMIM